MKYNKPNQKKANKQQYSYEPMSEQDQDLFEMLINEIMFDNNTVTTSYDKGENVENYKQLSFDDL